MSVEVRARQALQIHFGFTEFREGQAEVIDAVLKGENAVVVMPTGGGKSLCYQLPAMMLDGVTLVVSPLIALMKDQVDALIARKIPTTFINSSLAYGELKKRLSEIRRGVYKLVYIAPERFRSEAFIESISEIGVRLLAIDEAHCISHWGHDFRPDYLKLKQASEQLGNPQVIALTATATQKVREDISAQLGLENPRVFVAGFDRPNLALRVLHTATEKEKLTTIKNLLTASKGSGIIYAATRKAVEQISAKLKMADLDVEAYHAGLTDQERSRAQEKFMSGDCQAIIATNAFGMGIDKSDIRFVVHYHIPGTIEAYYQEVGRAGRDGLPSDCLLLFNYADTRTQQFFIEGSHPPPELIEDVYEEIAGCGSEYVELSAKEIAARLRVKNEMSIYSALVVLEKAGHIERGRPANTALLASLQRSIDEALAAVSDELNEGGVLRDLIFNRNVSQRQPAEFDVNAIIATLGLSENEVRRALSNLSALGVLEYRNAYQGRGIHILDQEPPKVLRFDRKELAARLAAEQWKMRKMLDYGYYKKCLRGFILNYFGERKHIVNCGTCSSCAPHAGSLQISPAPAKPGTLTIPGAAPTSVHTVPPSRPAAPSDYDKQLLDQAPKGAALRNQLRQLSERDALQNAPPVAALQARGRQLTAAEVIVVKKILSCVARMKNRFGKGAVAAVLKGSKSKQIRENHLDQLSTYGLLKELSQDEISAYIKALIQADCITIKEGVYPIAGLTTLGREVMLGETEVLLDLPQ
ncbi:MAG: RecQ family ATP-dependent DNA helicase [Acidobacteria bacterium]|nr:RecQ family ATP-dependent DNA helicase [Acidobacteriota bacterium]